jgi:hypothetical protein
MEPLLFFFILFIVLVGGGWVVGKSIGNVLFPSEKKDNITFVNNITHHHHHEHKNISIIDDETKKRIFELKESKDAD